MATETRTTQIKDLVVDSEKNCYRLDPDTVMKEIEAKGVTADLEPGIHIIRIREGSFDYVKDPHNKETEPLVMLWVYGGKFKNLKTNKEVSAGWSTLNGYDDTVTLAVSKDSKLCAFFFDTETRDNAGQVVVSVVKVDEVRDNFDRKSS